MSIRKNQAGFSVVEVVLLLAIAGLLAYIGYRVYGQYSSTNNPNTASTSSESRVASDVPSAPQIKSTRDLDKASATLDQIDVNASGDNSKLDSELESF